MEKLVVFSLMFSLLCSCASQNCASPGHDNSPVTKRSVVVDGLRIAYEDYGHGDVVLFVHGFGASSYSWRKVATILANNGWRCISVDLMGFGASAKPTGASYTLEKQASLIRLFAEELNLSSIHVVGHSYGGGVCLALQADLMKQAHPMLALRSLTLVDTVCYPQEFPGFIKLLRMPVISRISLNVVSPKKCSKSILKLCYYSHDKITDETIAEYAKGFAMPGSHSAMVATARNIIPANMEVLLESYSQIHIPTLILWGDHDRIVPGALGQRLAQAIPSASLRVFADCGHIPQEEFPEKTSQEISSFLGSVR